MSLFNLLLTKQGRKDKAVSFYSPFTLIIFIEFINSDISTIFN